MTKETTPGKSNILPTEMISKPPHLISPPDLLQSLAAPPAAPQAHHFPRELPWSQLGASPAAASPIQDRTEHMIILSIEH